VVSPFGAAAMAGFRTSNLAWKLAAVIRGEHATLLETYNTERGDGADENIATPATRPTS